MPGFDGTGPQGGGPMTGGGRGYCVMPGGNIPSGFGRGGRFRAPGASLGWRRGRLGWSQGVDGGGWVSRMMPGDAPGSGEQELFRLQQHADAIQQDLDRIRRRIAELGG